MNIKLFESKKVRTEWHSEKWYFSIVDVIAILTDNDFQGARNYWKVLKHRLKKEGNESVTNCNQLKLLSSDGKKYLTDVADTEQVLRLIQSIPSKKAEPFKAWLAQVGKERIDETEDPELAFDRGMKTYLQKGYSKERINQRLKTIEIRKELTDEWDMNTFNKIFIVEKLSPDLALRDNADRLFDSFESDTLIDFKNVKSISRSFAHQYQLRKNKFSKKIIEKNVPTNVKKMFKIVENPQKKEQLIDLTKLKPISI